MPDESIKHYLPEEVPGHLFTQSRLSRMGLAPTEGHVAFVLYPEQRRQYKLFNIDGTKKRKQQKGLSLVQKDATIEQILAEREHEMKVRKSQLGSMQK